MDGCALNDYPTVINEISRLNWPALSGDELMAVALAYYYFSIQFRESLEVACELYPADPKLAQLRREECGTDNLSPWPGVASPGERMNHDEFMRRTLELSPIDPEMRSRVEALGDTYLAETRALSRSAKAFSIASYEDGGLEATFNAMLRAPCWDGELLGAFRHFLTEHIRFDSDPDQGHGALSRHITPDDGVLSAWRAFHEMLVGAVPKLAS